MRARRRVKKDPLETAVFFIDRSVGKKTVANALREAGLHVEVHDDHFAQDALDYLDNGDAEVLGKYLWLRPELQKCLDADSAAPKK